MCGTPRMPTRNDVCATTRRLIAVIVSVVALAAIGTATASAAPTMPAANPIDYASLAQGAQAKVFNVTIKDTKLEGNAFTTTVNNGLMGGMGATITVGKAAVKNNLMGVLYQTITIRPTKVGQVTSTITNAFATLSGGNYGSVVISSTSLNRAGSAYIVKMRFNEQASNSNLNLNLYHS